MAEGSSIFSYLPYQGLCFFGKVTEVVSATSFRVAMLAGKGDSFFVNYNAYVVRDAGGAGAAPQGEQQTVSAYVSASGLFTTPAFTVALAVGDEILMVNTPVIGGTEITTPSGSTTANWNAAEADVVSIGANDIKYKVKSLLLDINALVGTVTIRMYMQINGVERQVFTQDVSVALDGPGIWLVNGGEMCIHEVLRVTVESDNAADDGAAIAYDYMLEEL
ncbi:MAG: hypothetical protein PHU23_12020 [Dehalococcoidales bacterium]|nr:hypothetical protein [Dehalococcoidales bacterium]